MSCGPLWGLRREQTQSWFDLHTFYYVEGFQKCSIGVLGPVARVACWGQLGLFDQSSGLECPTPSILRALQVQQGPGSCIRDNVQGDSAVLAIKYWVGRSTSAGRVSQRGI